MALHKYHTTMSKAAKPKKRGAKSSPKPKRNSKQKSRSPRY